MTPEDYRAGIDYVFIGILRRRAVRGFENRIAIADVCTRSDAEAADLCGARVGNIIAV